MARVCASASHPAHFYRRARDHLRTTATDLFRRPAKSTQLPRAAALGVSGAFLGVSIRVFQSIPVKNIAVAP
jgi:hypothetical protein